MPIVNRKLFSQDQIKAIANDMKNGLAEDGFDVHNLLPGLS